jgi:hypothetical protein
MKLEPGQQLLHYRLTEKIGEGGMGVVWLARDTSLDRDVAIKVLPAAFAADPTRMTRFEREAKLVASLSHPNIAAVHGLHEAGEGADTVRFIAMEFVPGEDVAERLARGPMAVDEALQVAHKIALGMAAAHDNGTIHRDLKPANVRLSPTGEVKVLDFGLARGMETTSGDDVSNSPTITSAGTVAGVLLGTAAYMSPEQARGRTVDRRADVWAFGCLLYECLTGRRVFPGDTISDILAEVLKSEPDWSALPAETPASVRRLLRRCLAKDPESRLRDLGDAALELVETDEPAIAAVEAPGAEPSRRGGLSWGIAVAGILGALVLGYVIGGGSNDETPVSPDAIRAGIVALPESAEIAYGAAPIGYDSPMLTISADGRELVYVGRDGDGSRLYHQDLSSFDPPRPIPGTEGALQAFFSPFESSVAFYTNDKLARVDVSGDRLQVLGDVNSPTRLIWADDRKIYLGDAQAGQLRVFPENGGDAKDHGLLPARHSLTDVLPGGGRVLFHEKPGHLRTEFGEVKLLDLETNEQRLLVTNAYDATVRGDRIYFIRDSALLSAPFDVRAGEVTGEPEIVVRDVAVDSIFGQAQVALSPSGTLAYLPGGDRALGTIAWVDRDGERGNLPVEPRVYGTIDLSPDDRRIAVGVGDVRDYVWIYDLERQSGRKLPSDSGSAGWPVWNSAGDSITYTKSGETFHLVEQLVDSRGIPRRLHETPYAVSSGNWSPDDSLMAFSVSPNILVVDNGGNAVEVPFPGFMPDWSPDGEWLVYNSEQAGVYETIVRSWPLDHQVYSLQTEGGIENLWAANGELFWRLGDRWYVVRTTTTGDTFEWTPPELAFEIPFLDTPGRSYVVTSDGQRLYTIVQAEADIEDRIHVISGLVGR